MFNKKKPVEGPELATLEAHNDLEGRLNRFESKMMDSLSNLEQRIDDVRTEIFARIEGIEEPIHRALHELLARIETVRVDLEQQADVPAAAIAAAKRETETRFVEIDGHICTLRGRMNPVEEVASLREALYEELVALVNCFDEANRQRALEGFAALDPVATQAILIERFRSQVSNDGERLLKFVADERQRKMRLRVGCSFGTGLVSDVPAWLRPASRAGGRSPGRPQSVLTSLRRQGHERECSYALEDEIASLPLPALVAGPQSPGLIGTSDAYTPTMPTTPQSLSPAGIAARRQNMVRAVDEDCGRRANR